MNEIELIPGKLSNDDNTINVEMSKEEIWFLKTFIKNYNPKKIVEIGISAGGNTVNLLKWKNRDSQLFSVDLATQWYKDKTKLSGFMADELNVKDNFKLYLGCDYFEVCEEIGNDIDAIIIDTTHILPGELLTFLAALPQLKNGCVVILHDIHLNMLSIHTNRFSEYGIAAFCTGLLFGSVSSNKKWTLKSNISNIGAFIVDDSTRNNIKDIFHILCTTWNSYPYNLDLKKYLNYIQDNYSLDCHNLFENLLKLQSKYETYKNRCVAKTARIDIINKNKKNNNIKILNSSDDLDIKFPEWYKTDDGQGVIVQTRKKSFDLKFKCHGSGLLTIRLRGPDVRDEFGNWVPSYVNFKTFEVNNKNMLKEDLLVWHNKSYVFEKNVHNGQIIKLHIEWSQFEP